jgi:periplasmic protein TonB
VLLVAIVVGLSMRSRKSSSTPPQTETAPQASNAEPESKPEASPQSTTPVPSAPAAAAPAAPVSRATGSFGGEVLNRDVPNVSQRASNTIHGTVSVIVRVSVDPTGAITNADFTNHGPSAYFARIALESARNWKFKPPQQNGHATPSTWLLHYKFRRGGVEVTPNQTSRD